MDINYNITFHTYWHCGSGLAAGADADALVVKDNNGLPFVPGKTIKGLIRESINDIIDFTSQNELQDLISKTLGVANDGEDAQTQRGKAFFTNAELPQHEQQSIISNKLLPYLYHNISRTAIDENGIAKEHSLRKIETVIPCVLEGKIMNVPEELETLFAQALQYIKRLGSDRNRGLGRCTITIQKGAEK